MKAARLYGLDGLRGVAALCVLVYHSAPIKFHNAFLAVDFFFMLSGYVMARSYEGAFAKGMTVGDFLRIRLRRLWPTMFVASLVGLPFLYTLLPIETFWVVAIANLLLIPFPLQNRAYPLNGPAWSILFELLGNALHALLLWRLGTRQLAWMLAVCIVALALLGSRHTLEMGSTPDTMIGGAVRLAVSYGLGVMLWRLWQDKPGWTVSPEFALLAMPVLFAGGALASGPSLTLGLAFILVVCPMMIAGGLAVRQSIPLLTLLGEISFPLYAVHVPMFRMVKLLGGGTVLSLVATFAAAWLFVWIPRKWKARPRTGAQSAVAA